jgi:hypothetical protein
MESDWAPAAIFMDANRFGTRRASTVANDFRFLCSFTERIDHFTQILRRMSMNDGPGSGI